jgi:hypothetical protein
MYIPPFEILIFKIVELFKNSNFPGSKINHPVQVVGNWWMDWTGLISTAPDDRLLMAELWYHRTRATESEVYLKTLNENSF